MKIENKDMAKVDENILISFTKEESLVFFDWLSRFNENEHSELIQDQSEQRVLFDIESLLEEVLSDVFDQKYTELLTQAREKIRDNT